MNAKQYQAGLEKPRFFKEIFKGFLGFNVHFCECDTPSKHRILRDKLLSSNFWAFNIVIEETITIFRNKKPKLMGLFKLF